MKKKNIISLTIALAFLFLAITGLLLYFGLKPEPVTAIHVLLGLTFIAFTFFHIKNNWPSLKVYTKERKEGKIKKEFLIAAVVVGIFLIGAGFSLPPFAQIQHFGENLTRGEKKGEFFTKISFDNITTNQDHPGTPLHFIIEKANDVITPVMAIWIEDTSGNFIENIFVPAKIIVINAGEADKRHALLEGETAIENFTPAMLLQWHSKAKDATANYKDATPTDNFFLATKTKASGKFKIMLQIKDGEKNELYSAMIDIARESAVALKSSNSGLLIRAIAEVK